MFWLLLGYTVSKLCASPRNSTFFTRLFLLVRGWSLETRLITFSLCETCWTYTTFLPMLTLMYLCLYWSVCVCVLWCFVCPLHLLSLDREKPSVFTNMHYRETWHFVGLPIWKYAGKYIADALHQGFLSKSSSHSLYAWTTWPWKDAGLPSHSLSKIYQEHKWT